MAMDTFFLSHGSPTLSIDEKLPARQFFKSWRGKVLQAAPRAILAVSAHWDTAEPAVNVVERNNTIHDFYGFPSSMYQVQQFHLCGERKVTKLRPLADRGKMLPTTDAQRGVFVLTTSKVEVEQKS